MTDALGGILALAAVAVASRGFGAAALGGLGGRPRVRGPSNGLARLWLEVALGLGILAHLGMFIGLAGFFTRPALLVLLALGWGLAACSFVRKRKRAARCREGKPPAQSPPGAHRRIGWAARFAGAGMLLAMATLIPATAYPPLAYDVLEYHLQAPRLFFETKTLEGDPHNFFTRMPMATGVLYALGHAVVPPSSTDDRAAKWLAVGWVALFAWGCGALTSRLGGGPTARWGAVALAATLPLAGKIALDALSDAPTAVFIQFMTYGILGAIAPPAKNETRSQAKALLPPRRRGDLLLAAAGAGFALSCKWGVLPHLIVPAAGLLVLFGFSRRIPWSGLARATVFGVGTLLVFSPWMARAAWTTGNPVFPWAAARFPSESWTARHEAFLVETHKPLKPWQRDYWTKVEEGLRVVAPTAALVTGRFVVPPDEENNPSLVQYDRHESEETAQIVASGRKEEENGNASGRMLRIPLGALLAACALLPSGRGRRQRLAAALLGFAALAAWAGVREAPDRFLLPAAGILLPTAVATTATLGRRGFGRRADGRPPALHGRYLAWGFSGMLALVAVRNAGDQLELYLRDHAFTALRSPLFREEARGELLGHSLTVLQRKTAEAMAEEGGRLLILYEARGLLFPLPHSLNTVFDNSVLLDRIGDADTPDAIDRALAENKYTYIVVNEYEQDRLIRFYPTPGHPLPPPRETVVKSPLEPLPYLELYRPYVADARFAPRRETIREWHARVLRRAEWRWAGPDGLVLCLSPVPPLDSDTANQPASAHPRSPAASP